MPRYYKAVRPNGTDFWSGTIDYAAALATGEPIQHPDPRPGSRDATHYLSVATKVTECTGMRWPCRVFVVEPDGETWAPSSGLPHKVACTSVRVVEEVAATLAQLLARGGNRIGAVLFDTAVEQTIAPAQGRTQVLRILHALTTTTPNSPDAAARRPGSVTDLAGALHAMAGIARRRALIVVVSDFLTAGDDELDPNVPPQWERAMRHLAIRNQVLAVEVVDSHELALPDVGDLLIRDPETDFERYVNTSDDAARERMDAASAAQRERIRIALRRAGVAHIQLRTDRDWVHDIARFVLSYRRTASMLHAPPQGVTR